MTNPFLRVLASAGIFVSSAGSVAPNAIDRRLCAALCAAIQADASRDSLDADWWAECVGNVPGIVERSNISQRGAATPSAVWPDLCAHGFVEESAWRGAVASLIEKLPELEELNFLGVQFSSAPAPGTGTLHIALRSFRAGRFPADAASTHNHVWDAAYNEQTAAAFDQVFGSFEPLGVLPYYSTVA